MPDAEAASILDASALIAFLHDEPGAATVLDAISQTAAISVVNWAETLSKIAADGDDPQTIAAGFEGTLILEPLTETDCLEIAVLRPLTKARGLSLADRACLTLAKRLDIPILTADRSWANLNIGIDVQLIR